MHAVVAQRRRKLQIAAKDSSVQCRHQPAAAAAQAGQDVCLDVRLERLQQRSTLDRISPPASSSSSPYLHFSHSRHRNYVGTRGNRRCLITSMFIPCIFGKIYPKRIFPKNIGDATYKCSLYNKMPPNLSRSTKVKVSRKLTDHVQGECEL